MNKAMIAAAIFGLAGGSALAQEAGMFDQRENSALRDPGRPVYEAVVSLTSIEGENPISVALIDTIRTDFENSHSLELAREEKDRVIQVVAPAKITISGEGKQQRIDMIYEISGPRGTPMTYKTNCLTSRLEDCARAVGQRTQNFARTNAER